MIKVNLLKDTTNVGPISGTSTGTFATFAGGGGGIEPSGEANPKDMLVKVMLMIIPLGLAVVALTFAKDEKQKTLVQVRAAINSIEAKKVTLTPEIEAVKNFQKEKERLQVQIDTIKTLSRERLRNVKALESIQNLIPEKAWLSELKVVEGQVKFFGQAVDDQTIAQFMQGLEENVHFANVRLVKTSETSRAEGTVKVFEIESNMEGM